MRKRITPNPLAAQLEQEHGPLLDELHRLLGLIDRDGCCVIGPQGYQGGGEDEPIRPSTDAECRDVEISIHATLRFFLTSGDPVRDILRELSYLEDNIAEVKAGISRFAAVTKPQRKNGKRGAE